MKCVIKCQNYEIKLASIILLDKFLSKLLIIVTMGCFVSSWNVNNYTYQVCHT